MRFYPSHVPRFSIRTRSSLNGLWEKLLASGFDGTLWLAVFQRDQDLPKKQAQIKLQWTKEE
jgi:hypothetical protein